MNASMRAMTVLAALMAIVTSTTARADSGSDSKREWIWWEGEDADKTNFPDRSWFSPRKNERDVLSGGAWLSNSGKRKKGQAAAFARYEIDVPQAGRYNFWVRKMWKHGPFRWRFDEGTWSTCPRDIALADSATLRTHVSANWVYLGKVTLEKGRHTFELQLQAGEGEALTAAFDAFLLIPGTFFPAGKLKPGQKTGLAEEGYFAYEPSADVFSDDALLDLRHLNEKRAGADGRIRVKGDKLIRGDGREIRFWAVNVSSGNAAQNRQSIDYLARKLAKLGVNMVRYHSPLFDRDDPEKVNRQKLDDLHYLVAAMQKQGIYTTVSFYFPLWFNGRVGQIEGYNNFRNKRTFAMLFYNDRMQTLWKAWARQLLTTKNSYTGKPLSQDASLAMVEITNEDSFFFWTFTRNNIPEVQWKALEKRYSAWLAKRYGSLDKAFAAWGKARMKRDDRDAGIAGLYDAWHMTRQGVKVGGKDKAARVSDQVRFLAEAQAGWYEQAADYLEDELDYDGMVTCSNWTTADNVQLGAIERHTYRQGDVIDRHGYFGPPHKGEGSSYSVRVGHTCSDLTGLKNPHKLPLGIRQVAGFPHTISEINWPQPNRYRAEATLLGATYASLQGIDGLYWFAVSSNYLRDTSIGKFQLGSPALAGTFPAAAILYRGRYVTTPEPAVVARLKLSALYGLSGEKGSEAAALDQLRQADVGDAGNDGEDPSQLAFWVGPVVRAYDDDKVEGDGVELGKYIDLEDKTIRSRTGEVKLDYDAGLLTVSAERAKAAGGFLSKAGTIDLKGASIECGNEFASILIVPLDGQKLSESRRVLIQAMTEEKPFGYRKKGNTITDLGRFPFGVRKIDATITLDAGSRTGEVTVTALDENGYAMGKSGKVAAKNGKVTIRLFPETMYHVLQWRGP